MQNKSPKLNLLFGDVGSLMADWCGFMMRVMMGEFVLCRNNGGGVKMRGWVETTKDDGMQYGWPCEYCFQVYVLFFIFMQVWHEDDGEPES